jgi:hypothetical protein
VYPIRVNTDCFTFAILAHAMQMDDCNTVTDFEHIRLGCGFHHRRLNLGSGSAASSSFSKPDCILKRLGASGCGPVSENPGGLNGSMQHLARIYFHECQKPNSIREA